MVTNDWMDEGPAKGGLGAEDGGRGGVLDDSEFPGGDRSRKSRLAGG